MNDNENKIFEEIVNPETVLCTLQGPIKTLKRQKGLGRLNRLVASSTEKLVALGHDNKRFKRDYATGVAMYKCPSCQSVAAVGLGQGRAQVHATGDAFENNCNKAK